MPSSWMVVKFGLVLRCITDIVSQGAFREQVSTLFLFDPVVYSCSTLPISLICFVEMWTPLGWCLCWLGGLDDVNEGDVGDPQVNEKWIYVQYILLVPWDGFNRLTRFVSTGSGGWSLAMSICSPFKGCKLVQNHGPLEHGSNISPTHKSSELTLW